jgi:hypothetical protein
LINGLVRMGIPGYVTSAVTGMILLAAVGIDVKWSKNRGKAIQKIYVNPAFVPLASAPAVQPGAASPYAQNDRLISAQAIGVDQVEGPEDVILDRQGRLYGSDLAVGRDVEVVGHAQAGVIIQLVPGAVGLVGDLEDTTVGRDAVDAHAGDRDDQILVAIELHAERPAADMGTRRPRPRAR